ncbi:hypothetical protein, partial [Cellulosimicrobium funkei]
VAVVYGATAMSVTLPAGQVFSTAFTYRQTRRWGASPVVASWQLVFSGVVSAAGLALIGVLGTTPHVSTRGRRRPRRPEEHRCTPDRPTASAVDPAAWPGWRPWRPPPRSP